MNYKWTIKQPNQFVLKQFEGKDIPYVLGLILSNRGWGAKDYEQMTTRFWELTEHYSTNICGINAAAKKILRLYFEGYNIKVFGDYDTDGITSSAIFNDFMTALKNNNKNFAGLFSIHVPERVEGYGLNDIWCASVIKDHVENNKKTLVVTFDNGITKNEQIKLLNLAGIETIIIDHHESEGNIPEGIVVDPKKDGERLGEELCGAGLAWILVYKMYRIYMEVSSFNDDNKLLADSLQRCLGYATVGTIGDMMPMTIYNMSLVFNGLKYLNNPGKNISPIHFLIKCFSFREINAKDIGFNIAAAINACGQMGSAKTALSLFIEPDSFTNEEYAKNACSLCNQSRDKTKKAKTIVNEDLANDIFKNDLFCIYVMKDIPHGIAGKLANHIAEKTGKPSIVLVDDGSDILKGSGRSGNDSINMLEVLKELEKEEIIKSAAGHKVACGVAFYKNKLEEAKIALNKILVEKAENNKIQLVQEKELFIDGIITIKDINMKNYNMVNMLPYSMNFYAPIFCIKGHIIKARSSLNNINNICYKIKDAATNDIIDIWVWDKKAREYFNTKPTEISIAGNLTKNFLNPRQITMDVIDLKFSL